MPTADNKLVTLADLKTAYDTVVRHDKAQTLTTDQQKTASANIGAVSKTAFTPDMLYTQIFGDNSDWSVTQYTSYKMEKVGRTFSCTGNNNTATSHNNVNLTGTTHTNRGGDFNGWEDSAFEDADFIQIPNILKNVHYTDERYRVGLRVHYNMVRLSAESTAGLAFGIALRRPNEDDPTVYDYYRINNTLPTISQGFGNGHSYGLVCTSQYSLTTGKQLLNDSTLYPGYDRIPWPEYTEMAIYLIRRNRTCYGSFVIEPFVEQMPVDIASLNQRIDVAHNFVDYGYNFYFYGQSTSVHNYTVTKAGSCIALNTPDKDTPLSTTSFMRITKAYVRNSGSSQINSWAGGLSLEENHLYLLRMKLISGSVVFTSAAPSIVVYPVGTHTNLTIQRSSTTDEKNFWRIFRAGSSLVNLSFNSGAGVVFNDAVYQITLEDMSESSIYASDTDTDPVIIGCPGQNYICGTVNTLDFTPCSFGQCSVRFTSGTTPTVLTLPNTVKMPDWWTGVEASRTYEISFEDGYGAVTSWA